MRPPSTGDLIRLHLDSSYPLDEFCDQARLLVERDRIARCLALSLQSSVNTQHRGHHRLSVVPSTALALVEGKEVAYCGRTWNRVVPLVLVSSDYHPYTLVPAPTGNIIWLDPRTEESLLRTAITAGALQVVSPALQQLVSRAG